MRQRGKGRVPMRSKGKNVHYEFLLRAQCDSVSALQKCGAYRGVDGIVWNYPALRAHEHDY
jgi:hypothetical protein